MQQFSHQGTENTWRICTENTDLFSWHHSLTNRQHVQTNIITLEALVRTKYSICMMNDRWEEALRFHPSKMPGCVSFSFQK